MATIYSCPIWAHGRLNKGRQNLPGAHDKIRDDLINTLELIVAGGLAHSVAGQFKPEEQGAQRHGGNDLSLNT
jgi:hypothetical protein